MTEVWGALQELWRVHNVLIVFLMVGLWFLLFIYLPVKRKKFRIDKIYILDDFKDGVHNIIIEYHHETSRSLGKTIIFEVDADDIKRVTQNLIEFFKKYKYKKTYTAELPKNKSAKKLEILKGGKSDKGDFSEKEIKNVAKKKEVRI